MICDALAELLAADATVAAQTNGGALVFASDLPENADYPCIRTFDLTNFPAEDLNGQLDDLTTSRFRIDIYGQDMSVIKPLCKHIAKTLLPGSNGRTVGDVFCRQFFGINWTQFDESEEFYRLIVEGNLHWRYTS